MLAKNLVAVPFACLAIASCAGANAPAPAPDGARQITAAVTGWVTSFNNREVGNVCSLFAVNAVTRYAGKPDWAYPQICAALTAGLQDPGVRYTYDIKLGEVTVSGDLGVVSAVWNLKATRLAGDEQTTVEPTLDVFQHQPDGSWKIVQAMGYTTQAAVLPASPALPAQAMQAPPPPMPMPNIPTDVPSAEPPPVPTLATTPVAVQPPVPQSEPPPIPAPQPAPTAASSEPRSPATAIPLPAAEAFQPPEPIAQPAAAAPPAVAAPPASQAAIGKPQGSLRITNWWPAVPPEQAGSAPPASQASPTAEPPVPGFCSERARTSAERAAHTRYCH